ncbi:hypothetical protein [Arthrobacter sp. UYEF21]|uniref:hypothetical protein n=1 Tax=Arthrobacter sp. UYEF21 TaxID=1756364 RepID=UPI0033982B9D
MKFQITDNTDQNHMTATAFKRAVNIAGLTLPAFNPATVSTADFTPATATQVSEAAYKAATAGKDPSADKEVQRLLMSKLLGDQIGGMYHRNQVALSRAELEHYQAHAPALLEELRTMFDDAVETMTEQIPVLGATHLEDRLREIGNIPEKQAHAITAAYSANKKAASLIEALTTVAAAANGETLAAGGRYGHLLYTKPTAAQFDHHSLSSHTTHNNYGRAHNVWDLLNNGVPVELATTAEEVKARVNAIEHPEAPRDYRAEEARRDVARAHAKALGIR